jgi:hypothetical protein
MIAVVNNDPVYAKIPVSDNRNRLEWMFGYLFPSLFVVGICSLLMEWESM